MLTFFEFSQKLDEAGGMGTIGATCMRCGKRQAVSRYDWNGGKAKCRACGGGLDVAPQTGEASPTDELRQKIAQLTLDPEVRKGEAISDMIHIHNVPEDQAYAKAGVTPEQAAALMDKAALLFTYKRKLKRLDPDYDMEADLAQH